MFPASTPLGYRTHYSFFTWVKHGATTGPLLVKALNDTNAAAVDKALEALQSFLQKAGQPVTEKYTLLLSPVLCPSATRHEKPLLPVVEVGQLCRIAGPACQAIASKQLKQRPLTVKKCGDVLTLFVEVEQGDIVAVWLGNGPVCVAIELGRV